jgi:hypothetical protein
LASGKHAGEDLSQIIAHEGLNAAYSLDLLMTGTRSNVFLDAPRLPERVVEERDTTSTEFRRFISPRDMVSAASM